MNNLKPLALFTSYTMHERFCAHWMKDAGVHKKVITNEKRSRFSLVITFHLKNSLLAGEQTIFKRYYRSAYLLSDTIASVAARMMMRYLNTPMQCMRLYTITVFTT